MVREHEFNLAHPCAVTPVAHSLSDLRYTQGLVRESRLEAAQKQLSYVHTVIEELCTAESAYQTFCVPSNFKIERAIQDHKLVVVTHNMASVRHFIAHMVAQHTANQLRASSVEWLYVDMCGAVASTNWRGTKALRVHVRQWAHDLNDCAWSLSPSEQEGCITLRELATKKEHAVKFDAHAFNAEQVRSGLGAYMETQISLAGCAATLDLGQSPEWDMDRIVGRTEPVAKVLAELNTSQSFK